MVTTLELLHKVQHHAIVLLRLLCVPAAICRTEIAVRPDFTAKASQKELIAGTHQIQP